MDKRNYNVSKIRFLLPVDLTVSTASSISDNFDIPVEIINGLILLDTCLLKVYLLDLLMQF
jgi:hypothetical protein